MISTDWRKHVLIDANGCWIWQGTRHPDGYPVQWMSDLHTGVKVHRLALGSRLGRPVRSDLLALHTCHVRLCVNPDHLYEGTHADNGRDKALAGRSRNRYTVRTLGRLNEGIFRKGEAA